jgi:hypothetical protein
VASVNTFNAGTSPLGKVTLKPKSKIYKQIAEQSTHHIIRGDAISENAQSNMIGKIKKYKTKQYPTLSQRLLKMAGKFSFISPIAALGHWAGTKINDTMKNHSIDNFIM